MGDEDAEVACQAWTTKLPKAAQPNLNYMGRLELNMFSILYCLNRFLIVKALVGTFKKKKALLFSGHFEYFTNFR